MPINPSDILPATGAPAAPVGVTPTAPAAPEATDGSIPDAVLQIPSFRALLTGAPPAARVNYDEDFPEKPIIEANVKPLMDAGFGFYKSLDGQSSVIFNTQFVSEKELKGADKAGKLDTIAPPFSELKSFIDQGLAEQPTEAAPTAQPNPGPVANTPDTVTNARLKGVALGSPTSGPTPGNGRILNSILKPVV